MRDSDCGTWTKRFSLFLLEEVSMPVIRVLAFLPITCLFFFPTCADKAVCLGCRLRLKWKGQAANYQSQCGLPGKL